MQHKHRGGQQQQQQQQPRTSNTKLKWQQLQRQQLRVHSRTGPEVWGLASSGAS